MMRVLCDHFAEVLGLF